MLLYTSQYLTVNYLEVQFLSHIKWTEKATELNEEQIKAELINFTEKMVKRKARYILCDVQNIEHFFEQNFLDWWNINIFTKIASKKFERKAVLCSSNLSDNLELSDKLFTNPQKAMQWLLKYAKRKKLSFDDGNSPSCRH